MFSCYAFVRIVQSAERLRILRTPGVLGFVGSERQGTAIPAEQIENLQIALREKIPCAVHPFIREGSEFAFVGDPSTAWRGFFCGRAKMRV